jgi:hypothetical protein
MKFATLVTIQPLGIVVVEQTSMPKASGTPLTNWIVSTLLAAAVPPHALIKLTAVITQPGGVGVPSRQTDSVVPVGRFVRSRTVFALLACPGASGHVVEFVKLMVIEPVGSATKQIVESAFPGIARTIIAAKVRILFAIHDFIY